MDNIEQIREFFKNDRFATENGAVIDKVGKNSSVCSLEIQSRHLNAVNSLMGGVPFMLADFAFAVAANHEMPHIVSISSNISFLTAPKGKRLIANAKCVKDGKSTCYYSISVTDELSTQVADVNITGFKLTK